MSVYLSAGTSTSNIALKLTGTGNENSVRAQRAWLPSTSTPKYEYPSPDTSTANSNILDVEHAVHFVGFSVYKITAPTAIAGWHSTSDVTWAQWRLKSQADRLFVQHCVQTNNQENVCKKVRITGPFRRGLSSQRHWSFLWRAFPHKGPVMRKAFSCRDVNML